MPSRGHWVYDPDYGGKKIPAIIQADVIRCINPVAQEHYKVRYTRLDIRVRGQFCYIDPTSSHTLQMIGHLQVGRKPAKKPSSACAIPPPTCAACAISEMMSGALLFLPIAKKNTRFLSIPTANLPANLKTLFWHRLFI